MVTPEDLQKALTLAPICVAADGGAAQAVAAGVIPQAVIGDMDSLGEDVQMQLPQDRLHRIDEQDSTDFDKALRHVAAPVVIGVGFCGGRIDHQLAAFHTLLARAERPCILLAGAEIVFLAPRHVVMDCGAGDVVSLFPLVEMRMQSTGLEWPVDEVRFNPADTIGTSNRAVGRAELRTDVPGMLVIAPAALLAQVAGQMGRGRGWG